MTLLIHEYEGSLGSRLHKMEEGKYLAYAQWPDKKTWDHSGSNLPESADEVKQKMRETCEEIKTVYGADIIDDLLKENPF